MSPSVEAKVSVTEPDPGSVLLYRDEVVASGSQSVVAGGPDGPVRPGQEQNSQPGW